MAILIVGCWDWLLLVVVCYRSFEACTDQNRLPNCLKKMKSLAGQPFFSFFKRRKKTKMSPRAQAKLTITTNNQHPNTNHNQNVSQRSRKGRKGRKGRTWSVRKEVGLKIRQGVLILLSRINECLYVHLHLCNSSKPL